MEIEDPDEFIPDNADYEEVINLVQDWGSSHLNDYKKDTIKIYFYSPFLFDRYFLEEKNWNDATKARLITSSDLKPLVAKKFINQMAAMERSFSTVCDAFQEIQHEDQWKDDVIALLRCTDKRNKTLDLDDIIPQVNDIPFFEQLRDPLDKYEHSSLILLLCLKNFFYLLSLFVFDEDKDPREELRNIPKDQLMKVDTLKGKGNVMFQKNKYRKAVTYYSSAIKIDRYNPVLYCNRAQANLYLDKNWEALLDAKRAVLLNPAWPKAYYRYSQALYELEFLEEAIEENQLGQKLCHDRETDVKDLQTQLNRFYSEKERVQYIERLLSVQLPPSLQELDLNVDDSSTDSDQQVSPARVVHPRHRIVLLDDNNQPTVPTEAPEAKRKATKETNKLEEIQKKQQELKRKEQQEKRKREKELKELRRIEEKKEKEKQIAKKEKERLEKEKLKTTLQQASKSYLDGRTRQAYEGYQRAEDLMKQSTKEFGGLTEGDLVIYFYAYGMAALETGNPQFYSSAVEKFELILTDHKTVRTALPYYGKALAYFKMNRFKDAFDPIDRGIHINKTFPTSVETWPGTDIDIEQTKRDCMEKSLSELKGNCRKPPPPEAYCRYEECNTRREIYVNDIAFKGYTKVHCSEDCKVDYHVGCWKNLRESANKKIDKDMLGTVCFTPDCQGLIEELSIYGEDGLVISNQNIKGQQEKTKVKTSSKQSKKEKKSKKSKFKEKGQGDPHLNEREAPDVSHVTVPVPPLLDVGIVLPALPVPSVCSSDGGDSVMTPDVDTQVDDVAETSTLHHDAAYILKKDEPKEKTVAPKVSKAKTKKKKKEAVTVDVDFADRSSRYFLTDADGPDSSRIPQTESWYFSEQHRPEVVLVTEEDRNEMFALHLHFLEILENNGPLKVNDSILLDELSRLTSEHQGIVSKHGGLAQFFLTAPDMFSVLENYVCRKEDLSKCRDILGRQKIVWAPLPSASHPRGGSTREPLLGRTPWDNQSHPKKDNSEENYQKPLKMNCLDMFNDGDLSGGTDVLSEDDHPPGITRQGLVYNQLDPITVSLTEQSEDEEEESEDEEEEEGDDDSDEERDSEIIVNSESIPNESLVVDNCKVPISSVQQIVANDEILTQGAKPATVSNGVVWTQGASPSAVNNGAVTQPPADDQITMEDEALNSLDPVKVADASKLPQARDLDEEAKPREAKLGIRDNVNLTEGENANGAAPIPYSEIAVSNIDSGISLEILNRRYREDEIDDTNPRCHSGISSDSTSSGTSSYSGVSSDTVSSLPSSDALVLWRSSAENILSLFPEFRTNGKVDGDDILLKIFSSQFYKVLEGLKERGKMHLKRTIGTCTYISHIDKGMNTDPFRTYEVEYFDVVTKFKNAESNFLVVSSKYEELVKSMNAQQKAAKKDEAIKNSVIERLQQSLRVKDEKMQQDNSLAQREKARLLKIILDHEAGARDIQKKLDEYNRIKETADQMKTEKENLMREREEFQRKMDEMNKECQRQRQRAIKSEINVVQIHKDQAMKPLLEALTECNYHISHLTRILKSEENANLTVILKDWERCLEENKQKVETTKNHFDNQLSELRSGRRMLTDLLVIPHPEPSRSKSLKSNHPAPQNWPTFGAPPPLPGSTIKGSATPFLRQQGIPHPAPPKPVDSSTSIRTNGNPSAHAPGLPPARGTAGTILQAPGSTMPLAPGPGAHHPPGLNHLPIPIGTRSNGAASPFMQGVAREKGTDLSAKVKHVPPSKSDAPIVNSAVPVKFPHNSQVRVSERQATAAPRSSYQRIMERLQKKFPHYNKVQLTNFLKVVRVNNGNSLSGLSMEGIMQKVADLIAEAEAISPQKPYVESNRESHQVTGTAATTRNSPLAVIPAAPVKNPWSVPVEDVSNSWHNEVYDDEVDPCVICHEEMALKEVLDLECGHRFHADCIEEWLGTKSTCPNCRKFTKLKQEYPPLQV